MKQNEYQIKSKNMTNYSEETSSISNISYEMENANNNDLPRNKIMTQTEKWKDDNKFPSNLEYVDSYTDPNRGTTSMAFLNKDTGKVTVGMAGTNVHGDQLKNTLNPFNFIKDKQEAIDARGSMLDFVADANIGLRTVTDKDAHFKNTQQFIKDIKKDYDIDTITGHSLGGRDAILMGVSNNIDNIVVYNPVPLTVKDIRYFIKSQSSSVSDIEKDGYVNKLLESYDGNILRIVSENDELDGVIKKTIYSSAGDEMIIKNGKGHSMLGFLGKREQREIKAKLEKLKGYQDTNNKSFIAAKSAIKDFGKGLGLIF